MTQAVFDAVTVKGVNFDQNPSWTHTPVGTPSGVGIAITYRHTGGPPAINSVTYGGQNCSVKVGATDPSGTCRAVIYGLANPPAGAQTVQINFATAPDRASNACSITVTGGSTTDVFGASNSVSTTIDDPTVDLSPTTTDEYAIDGSVVNGDTNVGTPTAPQTEHYDAELSSGAGSASSKQASNTTTTMTWTSTNSLSRALVATVFKAGEAGGGLTAAAESAYLPGGLQPQTSPRTIVKW